MNNIELNVVIPMGGLGSRFINYGFSENKYLLPIDHTLTRMIEKAILTLNINIKNTNFIFILREENGVDVELREYLQDICIKNNYYCQILSVNKLTEGPASTVYIAKSVINNDIPLIVSNSDQILDWDFNKFYNECKQYDGCVLTYKPNYKLVIGEKDKHSFVRFDKGQPIEFVEKTIISEEALVGVHYYKKGKYFIEAYEYLFKNNIRAPNNEFYLSYTYQALLDFGKYIIGTSKLNNNETFYPVGEPEDYFNYYNIKSPFTIYKLSNFQILNNYNHFFKVDFLEKGKKNLTNNELIINLTNNTNLVFTTGSNHLLEFPENTYFLRIFNIYNIYSHINIENYTRGWLIGNFNPSLKKESNFEIGILTHNKMEKWPFHYHKEAIEINILIEGKMIINNIEISSGTIFIFNNNVISCPIFLENCRVVCIKIPSIPGDKFII